MPRADLGILDPIWTSAIITRNHAFMVYDTLYGRDSDFEPSPQMVAGHQIQSDERLRRLTLRDGLTWHTESASWRALASPAFVGGARKMRSGRRS